MPSTFSQILLHIVFSTKLRQEWITDAIEPRLYAFIGGIIRAEGGVLYTINGTPDHVHLLVRWGTDESVGTLLRNVKARSSRWIHQEYRELRAFSWQEGYGAFSVSQSQKKAVERYISQQKQHHRGRTFKEELLKLLRLHEVEFDEKYVFD